MTPRKPRTVTLTVRMTEEEMRAIRAAADREDRPLAQWVRLVLRQVVRAAGA